MEFRKSDGLKIFLNDKDLTQISTIYRINNACKQANVLAYDIYNNNNLIGFIMLRKFQEGMYIWDFAIDSHEQNQGFGTLALQEILDKMYEEHGAKYFTVSYTKGNNHARHIYEKVGFNQTSFEGEEDVPEINMEYKYRKRN
ncbi:MAG: GNAT family N-acetyltransferase [Bacilli bacterium]|nr:GNAT family N-acetyltransferase [Bacilli bacterium]